MDDVAVLVGSLALLDIDGYQAWEYARAIEGCGGIIALDLEGDTLNRDGLPKMEGG